MGNNSQAVLPATTNLNINWSVWQPNRVFAIYISKFQNKNLVDIPGFVNNLFRSAYSCVKSDPYVRPAWLDNSMQLEFRKQKTEVLLF